jgi:UDP-N-acetylglucosamine 2-epimerase (non-hydrolysing)
LKILSIFGTRPEAIKLAPVIRELEGRSTAAPLCSMVCVTAQHRQMLDQVLDIFHIKPDIDLDLMQAAQTPSQVAARVLTGLETALEAERPDWILVQGDTTTVMAASIAAYHLRIKIGHVEAGLRTGDRLNPFPEEMNRIVADHLSDLHFAPTSQARENLRREGIPDASIRVTGNTVTDALLDIAARPCPSEVQALIEPGTKLILVTAHRRESFGYPLRGICAAVRDLARYHEEVRIVYPVHLNPNVWQPVHELLDQAPRVKLLPPVDYVSLVHLMKNSYLIMTDSGGIQEEAPSLGVPVLILRETTERPEAVQAGAARIVGADPTHITLEASKLLDNPAEHAAMARAVNPFGDGRASQRIVDVLLTGDCQEFVAGA